MRKLIFLLMFLPSIVLGQCVFGDCDNGHGTYIYEDGSISNGSWRYGELNGIVQDIIYDDNGALIGTYDGEMVMGVISGWGTETLYDDDGSLLGTYVGQWNDNKYNGFGVWIWDDGTIEKGVYSNGVLVEPME